MNSVTSHISNLSKSTIRLKVSNAQTEGTGTGFFYAFQDNPLNMQSVYIVTNRHMVDGFTNLTMTFSLHETTELLPLPLDDLPSRCILHPDSKIDLAIIFVGDILQKNAIEAMCFSKELIPNDEELQDIYPLDSICLIGYPTGICDTKNNLPIFRKGVLATPPWVDYEGRKQFLIDASCFPGSSGSPVLSYNPVGALVDIEKGLQPDFRLYLIGIQSATFIYEATGKVLREEIPTRLEDLAITQIPNNLGIIVKSSCIFDFEKLIPQ